MKNTKKFHEKSPAATMVMIVIIAIFFIAAHLRITDLMEKRCLKRMEEGVNTAIGEITNKLERDSQILNATARLLEGMDSISAQEVKEAVRTLSPLMETMRIGVLMPDDTIIELSGTRDASGSLSFEELAPLGEHVSNRMTSLADGNTLIIRHYVPIVKDGETVAILFGVTRLKELPNTLNIDNIYNATASVYLINAQNGNLLMDTWHESLENIQSFDVEAVQGNDSWERTVANIMAQKRGYTVIRMEGSDEWMYFYYRPADVNRWVIAISVPESEAFASLYAVQRISLILAICTVLVVLLYYIWLRQNAKKTTADAVEKAVLEEKLHKAEAAERAKTMFLSNMSHDIRTPMNAIIGFTTLAQTNIDNRERVQEYLAKILSSGNHLLSLINDVLDMSRIESGKLNIEEKECSISDIFKDMRNIIQTQMQAKQLNFFMDTVDVVDEDIYCDKLHLNQVLLNLLGNAIKFTPAGGSVSLTIKQKAGAPTGYGSYEIRVKDTGIGMSPEFAEHVFEAFEREKTSTVSGIQGTGLGMAITKSIVDTMGGSIRVETEQGKGTEYIINLDFRLQSENRQEVAIQELQGLRALVVDDSFNTCDSVTKMLTQIGMRAQWTLRGKEAVLHAKQAMEMGDEYYAYIIDWALPDLNGIEVARQIRAVVGENVPIVILTAYDWTAITDEAREAGVTAFCNKPIFMSELRETLINAIGGKDPSTEEAIIPATTEELKGKRLLLVEDNELNREIAEEILGESGFVVESAEDGTIAVEMVEKSAPGYYDLILMDVQMPIMNGYEATKAIRKLEDPELSRIPIVAMTANAFDEDRKAALESGMDAHVAKPIDVAKLMEAIQSLLK
ncbi:MAG: response regulator [Acetatifactor sp.]|nr:response regulator [Acetatifactor sp.]